MLERRERRRSVLYPWLLLIAAAGNARAQGGAGVTAERNGPAVRVTDSAVAGERVYDGRSGRLNVRIPHVDTDAPVDGTLAAPTWQQAAVLTGFSEYQPVDGVPAEDSTQVLVWYSSRAIYFGIRAYEAHGAVHATIANRDKIDGDDNVQLIL